MSELHFAGADWLMMYGDLDPVLLQDLLDCGTPGQSANDAVAYVLETHKVTGDVANCAAYLRGYGAWDDAELADHDTNLSRLVWLAGCMLREEGMAHFATY